MKWIARVVAWFRRAKKQPEITNADLQAPSEFQVGIEAFAWRVLCDSYARVIFRMQGRDLLTVSRLEVQAVLIPYYPDIHRDAKALGVAIARARAEGVAELHRALHRAEGLDHEMVDQAVVYAYQQSKTVNR